VLTHQKCGITDSVAVTTLGHQIPGDASPAWISHID
jgi:hypothetical protein